MKVRPTKGRVGLDEIAVAGVHNIRKAAELEAAAGEKLVHLPEKPGPRVKLLEKNLGINNPNAIQDSFSTGQDQPLGALQVELEKIDGLQSLLFHQARERHRGHLHRSRDREIAAEPGRIA